ncbi:HEAT SHOCK PROTEIN 70KDA [Salix viminalis]|uniref:HEAT SHOCK PROTEIN 70KDA n=1 Tax=Salix viminalis TaxID=40686 RepID=A0A9Q0TPQ1_SALVM|nr:HEAT SHOCK PROTEIN 70KDA [Salix viminalis]
MEGGKPTIVTNVEGQRTTPSVVAYTKNGDRLVGQIAKRQAVVNPENTFFSVKRFIGRKMSEVDEESKQVSYKVVRDENGNVKLECPAIGKQFAAEEISAQVLRKLVDDASKFLNDKVTKAVVTLHYIYAVLEVGDGVFEVLSTSGDTHLGGDDFDKRVVDWLAGNFKRDEGIDLLKDKQALQRLTETAEKAKMELSSLTQTNISLPFITATADGPKHIETTLTRAKFEELCSDLLDRLKTPVENSLRDAKLAFKDLDEMKLLPLVLQFRLVSYLEITLPSDEVERMVSEAEKFSKEDKEKRDAIDTKNQADSVIYQTEKQLKELGEKVPAPVKEKVEAKLQELKDAVAGGSTQVMKDAMATLNQEVMQLGQSLYNQPGAAPGAGPAPGGEAGPSDSSSKGPDGDVIDADFTDSK